MASPYTTKYINFDSAWSVADESNKMLISYISDYITGFNQSCNFFGDMAFYVTSYGKRSADIDKQFADKKKTSSPHALGKAIDISCSVVSSHNKYGTKITPVDAQLLLWAYCQANSFPGNCVISGHVRHIHFDSMASVCKFQGEVLRDSIPVTEDITNIDWWIKYYNFEDKSGYSDEVKRLLDSKSSSKMSLIWLPAMVLALLMVGNK